MPGFDRRGPMGAGPRTGWGLGRCGNYAGRGIGQGGGGVQGVGRGGAARGGGRGRCIGGGRGIGYGRSDFADPATLSPADEAEALKAQLEVAEDEIAALKARLEELEKKG
jgi:Family of unknown function (DUF5320)